MRHNFINQRKDTKHFSVCFCLPCKQSGFVPYFKGANFFMPKKHKCGAYLRLSREFEANPSDSIENQKSLIKLYCTSHKDLEIIDFYEDEGVSGVGFDRPEFNRMMRDIDSGRINCVIVKDFSRLGRNHYECDNYMLYIFPQKKVRFISINDNYDSINEMTDSEMFLIPIKNIINDNYCRDISVKIRSQLKTKMELGQCVKSSAPYGYFKDPDNKNHLIVDECAAVIVRYIYVMKLKGYSLQAIADELNESGIQSPSEYKKSNNIKYSSNLKRNLIASWAHTEIRKILEDETYCGTLVQGKRVKPTFKCKKPKLQEKDKWIVYENAHEAIIERHVFDAVARLLELETRISPSQKTVYSLSGMVRCGVCGGKMTRKVKSNKYGTYHYLICSNKLKKECDMPMVSYELTEEVVLNTLKAHIHTMVDAFEVLKNINNETVSLLLNKSVSSEIERKENEIKAVERGIIVLHDKHLSGVLKEDEFRRLKALKAKTLSELESQLDLLKKKQEISTSSFVKNNQWYGVFEENKNISELKREVVSLFIDGIKMLPNKIVEVSFVYNTELENILKLYELSETLSYNKVSNY